MVAKNPQDMFQKKLKKSRKKYFQKMLDESKNSCNN